MLTHEQEAWAEGFRFILGIDEAGRGPLAGPVVAAAVCLTAHDFPCRIDDSKKMNPESRETAFHEIFQRAFVGIGIVSEAAIDAINILNASHLAMEFAVKQLVRRLPPEQKAQPREIFMLIDGDRFKSRLRYRYRTVVGGDARCLSIACASIIAKVYRDRVMANYDRIFPQYGFKQHKGYPTEEHREAIKTHGPSTIHRRSFSLL